MSDLSSFEAISWQIRMDRLIERMAKKCIGCLYAGSRCAFCDSSTAAGIIRDRDSEAANKPEPSSKMKPEARRLKVSEGMAGRGWLKPSEIMWPVATPANTRTMDLEILVMSRIVERMQPDPDNARVFLYRRSEP